MKKLILSGLFISILILRLYCPLQAEGSTNAQPPAEKASAEKAPAREPYYDSRHPDPSRSLNNYTVRLMAEFGLGNMVSFYALVKTFFVYTGLGIGYTYWSYSGDNTSLTIVEPYGVIIYPVNFFLLRLRVGRSYISEEYYGYKGNTWEISPDVLLKLRWQNIYVGIGLPVIMGPEGTGVAFSIGAGLTLTF
ncbi:MAG: hypothetical protein PHF84_02520 [bacterium]|nr:hypothetical protein [bacterium]